MRTFSQRMWRAVAFIESGREHCRQLDEAFENFDGEAMAAALYTLASRRPKLAHNLPQYVVAPFRECVAMVGRPMKEIRAEANRQRAEAMAARAAETA